MLVLVGGLFDLMYAASLLAVGFGVGCDCDSSGCVIVVLLWLIMLT